MIKTFVILCLCAGSLSALPIGNPSEATLLTEGVFCEQQREQWRVPVLPWWSALSARIGYYGDFVYNRHLRTEHTKAQIRQTKAVTDALYLAVNICDRLDVFATLGATYFRLNGPNALFSGNNLAFTELRTESDLSWSIGTRATLWKWRCLAVGGEFQYFSTSPEISSIVPYGSSADYFHGTEFKYAEWQAGLGASYFINLCSFSLVPYAGIKWSTPTVEFGAIRDGRFLEDLDGEHAMGYAVGFTLVGCRKFGVTLEKRFVDEDAFYANIQFRF